MPESVESACIIYMIIRCGARCDVRNDVSESYHPFHCVCVYVYDEESAARIQEFEMDQG